MKFSEGCRKVISKHLKIGDILFCNSRNIFWEVKNISRIGISVYSQKLDEENVNQGRGLIYKNEVERGKFTLKGKSNETDTNS